MKRFVIFLFLFPFVAMANDVATTDDVAVLQATVASLKREIEQLDKDLSECKQNTKGWTVATVVGSVGTVATGVGAAIQGSMLHKMKKEQQEKAKDQGDKK